MGEREEEWRKEMLLLLLLLLLFRLVLVSFLTPVVCVPFSLVAVQMIVVGSPPFKVQCVSLSCVCKALWSRREPRWAQLLKGARNESERAKPPSGPLSNIQL